MSSKQPAVSIKELQAELDALNALCPVLLPPPVPQGYDDEDLWGIVHTEGKEQQELFKHQLRAIVRQQRGQGQQQGCAVCGAAGQLSASHEPQQDEGSTLRFTTLPSVSFVDRIVHLNRAGFACGQCRALRDAGRYLVFLGTTTQAAAAGATGQQHEKRLQVASSLSLHLAATNEAPEQVQSNVDGCAVWSQEVASRAYALQVLASALPGWQVLGPGGVQVTQATPGLACSLLKALLAPAPKKKKQKSLQPPAKQPRAQEAQPAEIAASAGPQQEQLRPSSKKRKPTAVIEAELPIGNGVVPGETQIEKGFMAASVKTGAGKQQHRHPARLEQPSTTEPAAQQPAKKQKQAAGKVAVQGQQSQPGSKLKAAGPQAKGKTRRDC